jgi:hypothetical protein
MNGTHVCVRLGCLLGVMIVAVVVIVGGALIAAFCVS